jgi:hypothetical protein
MDDSKVMMYIFLPNSNTSISHMKNHNNDFVGNRCLLNLGVCKKLRKIKYIKDFFGNICSN